MGRATEGLSLIHILVIKDAKEETLQINRILTELLEIARPKPPQFRVSDVCSTVEHAVMFARQQAITKRITVEFEIKDTIPPVEHEDVYKRQSSSSPATRSARRSKIGRAHV